MPDVLNSGFLPSLTGSQPEEILTARIRKDNLQTGKQGRQKGAETRRYNASINMDYVLFDGLRDKAFQELSDPVGELEVRQTIQTTLLQLFSVYYEVARLEENNASLRETLDISRNQIERARYQFEYGTEHRSGCAQCRR